MMNQHKSFFLILGMHRSGTSCLTGALERCGVYLGPVVRKGKFNKKGYFEMVQVQKLHDQILGLNRGNWYLPPQKPEVHPFHINQLKIIAEQLKVNSPCGLKDPRTLLFIETWKQIIGPQLQLIGTFRHPLAVAHSLLTRNGIPLEQGFQLWLHYNHLLQKEYQKAAFPLIHYDLSDPVSYRRTLIAIGKNLGLKPQSWRLKRFISSKLEHHHYNYLEVPESCRNLYQYLIENARLSEPAMNINMG